MPIVKWTKRCVAQVIQVLVSFYYIDRIRYFTVPHVFSPGQSLKSAVFSPGWALLGVFQSFLCGAFKKHDLMIFENLEFFDLRSGISENSLASDFVRKKHMWVHRMIFFSRYYIDVSFIWLAQEKIQKEVGLNRLVLMVIRSINGRFSTHFIFYMRIWTTKIGKFCIIVTKINFYSRLKWWKNNWLTHVELWTSRMDALSKQAQANIRMVME